MTEKYTSDIPPLMDDDSVNVVVRASASRGGETPSHAASLSSLADSTLAMQGSESSRNRDFFDYASSSSTSDAEDEDESSDNVAVNIAAISCSEIESPVKEPSTDDDWVEEAGNSELLVKCLFCAEFHKTPYACLEHCRMAHGFNLRILKFKHKMEFYNFVKLVNFIRSCNPSAKEVMELEVPVWEQEQFMKPVIPDDGLLMLDFDDYSPIELVELDSEKPATPCCRRSSAAAGNLYVNAENGMVTLSQKHFEELQTNMQQMQIILEGRDEALKHCQHDINRMKATMHSLVLTETDTNFASEEEAPNLGDEDGYFSSYSHFGIHHEMLSDVIRTQSYRDAIMNNVELIKGKTVLDLGCGTGILSMFAAQAEANQVIGVDRSEIIFHAMGIIRENNLQDKITLLRAKAEDVHLPVSTVDFIVSEWMGYFLLYEGMLDSVLVARDKFLAPGGMLLPNRCTMSIAGVADPERHRIHVKFWDEVYGFSMKSLKEDVIKEPGVEIVPEAALITLPAIIHSLDLMTCSVSDTEFTSRFNLEVTRDGELTSLAGYFDTYFDLPNTVMFSTGPHAQPTHWKQTVFHLRDPIPVKKGQTLDCQIKVSKHTRESRWLDIVLDVNAASMKYALW